MCWLRTDQPLLLPGSSNCGVRRLSPCSAAQLLASRLRRIGDRLEKRWAVAGDADAGFGCRDAVAAAASGGGHLKGFLCMAVRLTVLVLIVARRHL